MLLIAVVAYLSRPGSPAHISSAWLHRGEGLSLPRLAHNPYLPSENLHGKEEGAGCWGSVPRVGVGGQIADKKLAAFALPVSWVAAGAPRRQEGGCSLGWHRGSPIPPPKGQAVTLAPSQGWVSLGGVLGIESGVFWVGLLCEMTRVLPKPQRF